MYSCKYFYDHYKKFENNQDYVKLIKYSYIYKTRIHTFIRVFILEYTYNHRNFLIHTRIRVVILCIQNIITHICVRV